MVSVMTSDLNRGIIQRDDTENELASPRFFAMGRESMNIRRPIRAGSFYEASPTSCSQAAAKLLEAPTPTGDLPSRCYGGIVPHAGWMYSGRLAGMTLKALHAAEPLETVIFLGADHTGSVVKGEVFDSGAWETPLGEAKINEELTSALLGASELLRSNPQAHANEHSIEVQVPLLQMLNPNARIVPIAVPPTDLAVEIGDAIGKVLGEGFPDVRIVGSTDLTHHGGHFPAPGGRGRQGIQWTVENDRRMIDLMERMAAEEIIAEASAHSNACGAGPIAATVAATRHMGATRGYTLEYTNSYEITHAMYPQNPDETAVGYVALVFG